MIKLTTLTTKFRTNCVVSANDIGEAMWPCTCILELTNCTTRVHRQTIIVDSFMDENLNSMPVLISVLENSFPLDTRPKGVLAGGAEPQV